MGFQEMLSLVPFLYIMLSSNSIFIREDKKNEE